MKPIKVSTIIPMCVIAALGIALLKWMLLPIATTVDPSGKASVVVSLATALFIAVYALCLIIRDTTSKKGENDNAA